MGWEEQIFQSSEGSLEELRCPICTLVAEDAVFAPTRCQDTFCEACIHSWLQRGTGSRACPLCRTTLSAEELQPHRLVRRLVSSLPVRCPTSSCEWKGTLCNWRAHQKECSATAVCQQKEECSATAVCQQNDYMRGVVSPAESDRRRKKKKKKQQPQHRGRSDKQVDDDDAVLHAAIAEANLERRLRMAGSGPVVQVSGETPVDIEGVGDRIFLNLTLMDWMRWAFVSRRWQSIAFSCGLSFHGRATVDLGYGFTLDGFRWEGRHYCPSAREDNGGELTLVVRSLRGGLLPLTPAVRWMRWLHVMDRASRILVGLPRRVSAVTLRELEGWNGIGQGRDPEKLMVPPFSGIGIKIPVSFLQSTLPDTDLEESGAIGLHLFNADGVSYAARVRDGRQSQWSHDPQHPLQNPRFDGEHGVVDELQGRREGLPRVFSGAFEIQAHAATELYAEWTLKVPQGESVLRAGAASGDVSQWWVRGHQQVGENYYTLEARQDGNVLNFRFLELKRQSVAEAVGSSYNMVG